MDPAVRELVRRRASNACEYCRIPQQATPVIPFHVEHIVSRQHGGADEPGSLALACDRGQIAGLTSRGRATVRLLNMNATRRVELRQEWLKLKEADLR